MSPGRLGACHFCHIAENHLRLGTLLKLPDDSVIAHVKCMQYSPQVITTESLNENVLGGFDVETVKKEIKRGNRTLCSHCAVKGGTIGCEVKSCKKTYHYLCLMADHGILVEDLKKERYIAYCNVHKDKTKSPRASISEQENDHEAAEKTVPWHVERPSDKIKRKKKSKPQTGSPREKRRKASHPKRVLINQATDSLCDMHNHSGSDITGSPRLASTPLDEQPGPSGLSRSSRSESDDMEEEEYDLPDFNGSNITSKKSERENMPTLEYEVHTSPTSTLQGEGSTDSCSSDASGQSESILRPTPKLLHSTSLSKTWRNNNATLNEIQVPATSEEKAIYDKMYDSLGGSLPTNMGDNIEAGEISNAGDLTMEDAANHLTRSAPEFTPPVSECSNASQSTTETPNADSSNTVERMEPEPTNGATENRTPVGTPDRKKPHLMVNSPLLDPKTQARFRNVAKQIQILWKKEISQTLPEREEEPANAGQSTSPSTANHVEESETAEDTSGMTITADPEMGASFTNFSSSQNADLYAQYKTVKEQLCGPGVIGSESGNCKKFWDMCQKKKCLDLYLEKIKCSLNRITENIVSGVAVEHEYEQAFRLLMLSRYVEGRASEDKEVIKQRISVIEDEKTQLSMELTMLDDLLT